MRISFFFALLLASTAIATDPDYGISGNPGAVNVLVGTGELGKLLQIPETTGVRLAGLWMADANTVFSGTDGRRFTGNNLLIIDLSVDLNKAMGWKGAFFGSEFLQFDGQSTNKDVGSVQGYNSITGSPPLNRSELYQIWLRQEFLDDKLSIRIGKTAPVYHFNNVSKPVTTSKPSLYIPSVTGLIYSPIFVNTTMLGVLGGYYNSVYGGVLTIAPTPVAYVNLGFFDGNLARGVQTGIKVGPTFNGYYFSIMEVGYGWTNDLPGMAAIGGWYQSGLLKAGDISQRGTGGFYLFGSQALWIKQSETTSKGNISGFYQFGWSNSKVFQMDLYIGAGLSGFALIQSRPNDSFGVGLAASRLNPHLFKRHWEYMIQGYYQMELYDSIFFEPVFTYIPNPGAHPNHTNVSSFTARMTVLF